MAYEFPLLTFKVDPYKISVKKCQSEHEISCLRSQKVGERQ